MHALPHRAIALAANDNRHNTPPSPVCAAASLTNGHVMQCIRISTRPSAGLGRETTTTGPPGADTSVFAYDSIAVVPWLTQAVSDTGVDALPPCGTVGVVEMALPSTGDASADADDDVDGMVDLSSDEDGDGDASEETLPMLTGTFPRTPPTVEAVCVGLSTAGQLFLNGHLLAANCNSFAIHDAFLLFSTHDHVCKFMNIRGSLASSLERFRAAATQPPDTGMLLCISMISSVCRLHWVRIEMV